LVASLRTLPGLELCQVADLAALAARAVVVRIPDGWPFIQERTPADTCYIVLSGGATVHRGGALLGELGPGAVIGEAGLVDAQLRNATICARGAMQALRVAYEDLQPLLAERQDMAKALLSGYRRRSVGLPSAERLGTPAQVHSCGGLPAVNVVPRRGGEES